MADENINLRTLACIQRHGAHFMDLRREELRNRSNRFTCQHCGLPNTSNEFHKAGVSLWQYSDGHFWLTAWRSNRCIVDKNHIDEKEVQHVLRLVGYRVDAGE